ncbi:isoprenylcysteine alpha-carbonyl methylesterase ICME isoform X2 [Cucumis sativus]|uniref:isoprenylcysteine alpha-carbonyl methylesterase ICME isoform X2 n=1 Tax=Cucumis sativus TaxID=3659 RepID=UPI0012F47AA0|nr:isoprenylcysteine alpha-carbonyl methylesterase ICME isoform X2 [Cucumis sativus]
MASTEIAVDTILIKEYGNEDANQHPFLHHLTAQAATAAANFKRQKRHRVSRECVLPSRRRSLGHIVSHAVALTFLPLRLGFKFLLCLWIGYKWIARFVSLLCYVAFISPGLLQVAYYYIYCGQIRKNIKYGDQPRNRLDIYLPKTRHGQKPKPVVVFVTGGAWILGNFPQGTMSDMIKDVSEGISFVFNNIEEYGGDINRIYLMGQSAGAHIAACAVVKQAIKEAGGEKVSWCVSRIKAYFGLSGGYNLINLKDHFHSRGLHRSIFLSIMEGEQSLQRFSPEVVVQDPKIKDAVSLLPHFILFHGTADYSIPSDSCKTFAEVLERIGVKVETVLYKGKTHTDLFVQDPMRGGKDQLVEDLISIIHENDRDALARNPMARQRRRLVPELLLKLACTVSPF